MSKDNSPFIPRFDYAAWTIHRPTGAEADRNVVAMRRYYWWVAHALFHKEPIPIPSLLDNPVPNLTGFVVSEKPGILRIEVLGPEYFPGRPRTGVPVATIYAFNDADGPCTVLNREWNQILHDYGSKKRTELPARAFITVIKHTYEKLDADLTRAVADISDFLGYAGWVHCAGISPPKGTQQRYMATLPASDRAARNHLEALAARQGPMTKVAEPTSVARPS